MASAQTDSEYLAFLKAQGQPSLLNTGHESNRANHPHRPLPTYKEINLNYDQAILGHDLFQEKLLSRDGTISCSTCHNGRGGGGDGKPVAIGINGQKGDINVPTVFNGGFHFRYFWDGRAFDLAEQAQQPVSNPIEMGHNWPELIEKLKETNYNARFESLYIDGLTQENIGHSIAQLERGLITNDAPYDRYLLGEDNSLSKSALRGLEHFQNYGCVACHNGINLGGNLYHKFENTLHSQNGIAPTPGVFTRSGRDQDRGVVKVPTLRNIARSAPYFHNAAFANLDEVIAVKISEQTRRPAEKQEINDIRAFLQSLSGKIPPTIREIF